MVLSLVGQDWSRIKVSHCQIEKLSDGFGGFRLNNTSVIFPDLASLVLACCSNENSELPRLVLPREIRSAKTSDQLHALASLGHQFWFPSSLQHHSCDDDKCSLIICDLKARDSCCVSLSNRKSFSQTTTTTSVTVDSSLHSIASEFCQTSREERTMSQVGSQILLKTTVKSQSTEIASSFSYDVSVIRQEPLHASCRTDDSQSSESSCSSGSHSGVNGIVYYKSTLVDKLSDYEDVWSDTESPDLMTCESTCESSESSCQSMTRTFLGATSHAAPTKSFASRRPAEQLTCSARDTTGAYNVSSQRGRVKHAGMISGGKVLGKISSHTNDELQYFGLNQVKHQSNLPSNAKKDSSNSEVSTSRCSATRGEERMQQVDHLLPTRLLSRVVDLDASAQAGNQISGHDQKQLNASETVVKTQQRYCSWQTAVDRPARTETRAFQFDFQQTPRLSSHVISLARNSSPASDPMNYPSPGYAFPCDALVGSVERRELTAPLLHKKFTDLHNRTGDGRCQDFSRSQSVVPNVRGESQTVLLESDKMCSIGGDSRKPRPRILKSLLHTAKKLSQKLPTSVIRQVSLRGCDRSQADCEFFRSFSQPPSCFSEERFLNDSSTAEDLLVPDYQLPVDALPCESVETRHPPYANIISPESSSRIFKEALPCHEVELSWEVSKENDNLFRRNVSKVNSSSARKKLLRRLQNRPGSYESGFRQSHKEITPTKSSSCRTSGDCSSFDCRLNTDMVARDQPTLHKPVRGQGSFYDNVDILSAHDSPAVHDIPGLLDVPQSGDPFFDLTPSHSRRMTMISQKTNISTSTQYCQPWENIRWSQLLTDATVYNPPTQGRTQARSSEVVSAHDNIDQHVQFSDLLFPNENASSCLFEEQACVCRVTGSETCPTSGDRNRSNVAYQGTSAESVSPLIINSVQCGADCFRRKGTVDNSDCWLQSSNSGPYFLDSGTVTNTKQRRLTELQIPADRITSSVDSLADETTVAANVAMQPHTSPDVIPDVSHDQPSLGSRRPELLVNRICSFIVDLSQKTETFFGRIIQNFIECTKHGKEQNPKMVVGNVRQFMNGLKNYISCHGEEALSCYVRRESIKMKPFEFISFEVIVERALHSAVVQPLHEHIHQLFINEHKRNGQFQMMSNGLQSAVAKNISRPVGHYNLSVETAITQSVRYLTMMDKTFSPAKKLDYLQLAIHSINTKAGLTEHRPEATLDSESLLWTLVRVLLRLGLVSAQFELEFTRGLMDPAFLTSEGRYHLVLLGCATELIRKLSEIQSENCAERIVNGMLLLVHVPNERNSNILTVRIPYQMNSSISDACNILAYLTKVNNPQDFGLFLVANGKETRVPDSSTFSTLFRTDRVEARPPYIVYKRINAKFVWPQNL